jgi:DNA-3-methyladenine glycosylase
MTKILAQEFYARDAKIVARDLLGKIIIHGDVSMRITETEAYCWPNDSANHGYKGRTSRNESMWGPAGHAYVYLCYGLHNMLNFVTNSEGEAAAVLIRSCELLIGLEVIKARRGCIKNLLTGPGNVGQALAIDRSYCHHPLFVEGGLAVLDAPLVQNIVTGSRIGIDYASVMDRKAHLRFADGDSLFVTKKHLLIRAS